MLCCPVLDRIPSLGHCYLSVLYVSLIDDVVRAHQTQYHQYADDLMLYTALVPSMFSDLTSVADCADAVSTWFIENALLLNPGKTEAVFFGMRQRLTGLDITGGVNVLAGSTVQFHDALKLLGVTLDASLSFDKHVTNVVRVCTFHTCATIHSSSAHLGVAKAVSVSIVGSRLDYCNSLLYGTTERNFD